MEPVGDAFDSVRWPTLGAESAPDDGTIESPADTVRSEAPAPLPAQTVVDNTSCPAVTPAPDLQRAPQFADITKINPDGLLATAMMGKIKANCTLTDKAINLDLAVSFGGQLGPAGVTSNDKDAFYSYPYFVAVLDPAGTIVAKDVFAVTLPFKAGQKNVVVEETLKQTITVSNPSVAVKSYRVMVGFQLSLEELEFIRPKPAAAAAQPTAPPTDKKKES